MGWLDGWKAIGDTFAEAGEKFKDGDILGGIYKGFSGLTTGAVNTLSLGTIGAAGGVDHILDGWDNVGNMFESAGESFSQGDIVGGLGETVASVASFGVNTVTGGAVAGVIDHADDKAEYYTDENGHKQYKNPNWWQKNIEQTYRNNDQLRDELCEEGGWRNILKANLEGGKLVGIEAAIAAATAATVYTGGAAAGAFAGAGGGIAGLTAAGSAAAGAVGSMGAGVAGAVSSVGFGGAVAIGAGAGGGWAALNSVADNDSFKEGMFNTFKGAFGGALTGAGVFTGGALAGKVAGLFGAGAATAGSVGGVAAGATLVGAVANSARQGLGEDNAIMATVTSMNLAETLGKACLDNGYVKAENIDAFNDVCKNYIATMSLSDDSVIDLNDPEQFAVIESMLAQNGLLEPKYYEDMVIDAYAEQYAAGEVSANYVNAQATLAGKLYTGQIADENTYNLAAVAIEMLPDNANVDGILEGIKMGTISAESLQALSNGKDDGIIDAMAADSIMGTFDPEHYEKLFAEAGLDINQALNLNPTVDVANAQITNNLQMTQQTTQGPVVDTTGSAFGTYNNTNAAMSNVLKSLLDNDKTMTTPGMSKVDYYSQKYGDAFNEFKDALVAAKLQTVLQQQGRTDILERSDNVFSDYSTQLTQSQDKLRELGVNDDKDFLNFVANGMEGAVDKEVKETTDAYGVDFNF